MIGFCWVIFLTMKRGKQQRQLDAAKQTRIVVTDTTDSAVGTSTNKKRPKSKDN